MNSDTPEPQVTQILLEKVASGDRQALDELLDLHRDLVRRFVELRLDPQMRARIDPSDVVQEAQLEMSQRIVEFLERKPMPFQLWVQQTAHENLIRQRRKHVQTGKRAVAREVWLPEDSSIQLAQRLVGAESSPSQKLVKQELVDRVREALAELPDTDRDILLMRTFEGLNNQEVAQVLRLEPSAASKRYGRALLRLRSLLTAGGEESAS